MGFLMRFHEGTGAPEIHVHKEQQLPVVCLSWSIGNSIRYKYH